RSSTLPIYTLSLHDALPIYLVVAFLWRHVADQWNAALVLRVILRDRAVRYLPHGIERDVVQRDNLPRDQARHSSLNTNLVAFVLDRKSTRLNSSHGSISYAV